MSILRVIHRPLAVPRGLLGCLLVVTACAGASDGPTDPDGGATGEPAEVALVELAPQRLDLVVGQRAPLAGRALTAAGAVITSKPLSWTSANAAVAVVGPDGMVSATGAGTTSVTATVDRRSAVAVVTVSPAPVAVASVTLAPQTATIAVGASTQLVATSRDASGAVLSGRTVTWSSSASQVATVSASGTVVGVAAGTAAILATVEGRTAVAQVVVTSAGANVTLAVDNRLIYPVTVRVAGAALGQVSAQSTRQFTVAGAPSLQVEWELQRPVLGGRPLGDPMAGVFTLTGAVSGTRSLTINNLVGDTWFFAPSVTNQTGVPLLLAVNFGLQAENRCACVAGAGQSRVAFGYYRLYSNSNVTAFRDGSGYTGRYVYFFDFGALIPAGSGVREFTFDSAP